jgi:hypothetical protein
MPLGGPRRRVLFAICNALPRPRRVHFCLRRALVGKPSLLPLLFRPPLQEGEATFQVAYPVSVAGSVVLALIVIGYILRRRQLRLDARLVAAAPKEAAKEADVSAPAAV